MLILMLKIFHTEIRHYRLITTYYFIVYGRRNCKYLQSDTDTTIDLKIFNEKFVITLNDYIDQ